MAKKLEVSQSDAVALFEALGLKTAHKWTLAKLTDKINEITETPDEPLGDSELDGLLDELMEAEEAVVVEDEEEEPDEDDVASDEDDGDEDDDNGDDDDEDEDGEEEEEEEEKPKAKKKGKGKSKPKAKAKGKSGKAKGSREGSIDSVTVALLKATPMTLKKLVKAIQKKFPDKDAEALERTTKTRVSGYLQGKGIKIVKNDKGVYSVK
jgi:hypothetical protein